MTRRRGARYRVTMTFDMGAVGFGRTDVRTVRRTTSAPRDFLRKVEANGLRLPRGRHEILYVAPHRLIKATISEA